MASYLVWDLRDLLATGKLTDRNAQERLNQLIELIDSGLRAAHLVYPAKTAGASAKGRVRERAERLASLNHDEELLHLILVAHGDEDQVRGQKWAEQASKVLNQVREDEWTKPKTDTEQRFIKEDVEDFLRRLQRIDQAETYRPPKRPGLTRR
jgi:hypothetical protein